MKVFTGWMASVALLALALALPGAGRADVIDDDGGPGEGTRRPVPEAAPAPAPAPAAAECRTWFPDFDSGCDRDGRWDGFHRPIVMPYLFEDPFITTGIYPVYIWHEFPNDSAFQGGDLNVVALQAQVAITDRLAFIAGKDGYGWLNPDNPLLDDHTGWFNLGFGLKYALIQDKERNFILSAIGQFEVPTGSSNLYQGHGSGEFRPALAAAWGIGDLRLIGGIGGNIPFDFDEQSQFLFYNLYGEYNVHKYLSPFVQFNGQYWTGGGDGSYRIRTKLGALPLSTVQSALGTGPFEANDVANLGSRGMAGKQVMTFAAGLHIPINEHVTLSAAYELPMTSTEFVFNQRVTTQISLEF